MDDKLYDCDVEKIISDKKISKDNELIKYTSKDLEKLLINSKKMPNETIVTRIGDNVLELKDGRIISRRAADDRPTETE